jgi:hypothetical protein
LASFLITDRDAIATTLLTFVVPSGNLHAALDTIAFSSWFPWAWLEIFDGVNYFRRALGSLVMIRIIILKVFSTI